MTQNEHDTRKSKVPDAPPDDCPGDHVGGGVTRREILQLSAAAASLSAMPASMMACSDSEVAPKSEVGRPVVESGGGRWHDKWTWDKHVKGTHNLNCWNQMSCSFNVYVADGKVLREEQAAIYPQTNPDVPDFNPRGCQKGCSYGHLMNSDCRILRPLKRRGERGGGQWEEVSWESALDDIADHMLTAIVESGTTSVVLDFGTNLVNQLTWESSLRFGDAIDATLLDMNSEIGDHQPGAIVTLGDAVGDRSLDDYFHADLIVMWGGNPAYTQIPNFHFFTEARYHGSHLVVIAPDMNASAMHADLWLPIKPGTDAALALGVTKLVIDAGRHDVALLREQTDLTALVREDNAKLLRGSDLMKGGDDDLYFWDEATARVEAFEQRTLALGDRVPALTGQFQVDTKEGLVAVRPVFERLKERLDAHYGLERVAAICGLHPTLITRFADLLLDSKAACNVGTTSIAKLYHGSAIQRAQILAFVISGHLGRPGDGWAPLSTLWADGSTNLFADLRHIDDMKWTIFKDYVPKLLRGYLESRNIERPARELFSDYYMNSRAFTNATLFWAEHGGTQTGSANNGDPALRRPARAYIDEAVDRGWQVLDPPKGKRPRIMFSVAGNFMRRVRSAHRLAEVLLPKLDLIVATELRMSSTAMIADYVLPVAAAYEKNFTLAMNTGTLTPFLHANVKAVDPAGQSRDEWWIYTGVLKALVAKANERGIKTFTTRSGKKREFADLYDRVTKKGRLGRNAHEKLSQTLADNSSNIDGDWAEMKRYGFVRFTGMGKSPINFGNATKWKEGETIHPHRLHREHKDTWPTLSGRMQFYVDHDWYLELDEALPGYKPPPKAGGNYPITITGGHTRWSIHATQRADPKLLRLQRGEPSMWVSKEDAQARHIVDGDQIEVWNDVGRFRCKARLSAGVQRGQAIIYHAWENYQFEGGFGPRNVSPSPVNPVELVGNYPYLRPIIAQAQPGGNDRDTKVDIRKL